MATNLEEGKFLLKPVKCHLKIDLVSHPACAEGFGFGLVWFGFMPHQPSWVINAKSILWINSSISENLVLYTYSLVLFDP